MGLNFSTSISKTSSDVSNRIYNSNKQVCNTSVVENISDNSIIISGSTVKNINVGNITGTSTDSSCTISSTMDNEISNMIRASVQQKQSTGSLNPFWVPIGWSFQSQSSDIEQVIANNIVQLNTEYCSANATVSTEDNFLYINNTNGGDVNAYNISGTTSNASCNMSNYMKVLSYNEESAKTDQKQSAALLSLLITCVVIGSVVAIFAIAFSSATRWKVAKENANIAIEKIRSESKNLEQIIKLSEDTKNNEVIKNETNLDQ